MAHDVFICHSSKDESIAYEINKFLESENITCWIAPRDVPPFQQWPDAIMDAIENCKIVVFILSSYSNVAEPVKREIVNAESQKKDILIIKIEDIPLNKFFKFFLEARQWIDAFEGPIENYKEKIINSIRQRLDEIKIDKDIVINNYPKENKWDVNKLIIAYSKAKFYPLDRFDPKTPLEMIKQNLGGDKVLPIMAELTRKSSIDEQIKYVKEQKYSDIYKDSWAEHELQIIGLHVLYKLYSKNRDVAFEKIYDAGCANCGQFDSLMAFFEMAFFEWEEKQKQVFEYLAQDFNPDWANKFKIRNGKFILESLPLVDLSMKEQCDVICCTHALHYLGNNPLAIYSSFFSFNQLLRLNGYCYVTVPEKSRLPGILDLLEKSARDAGFIIKESGKSRLIHTLTNEPHNITTFFYLILQKTDHVDQETWRQLIGASFYKLNSKTISSKYGVNKPSDINKNIKKLGKELTSIIVEEDKYIRLYRYAFDIVQNDWKDNVPDIRICSKNIEYYIHNIHTLMTDNTEHRPDVKQYLLQKACAAYFYWLVGFFISFDNGETVQEYIDILKSVLYDNKDIRVDVNDLNEEQVARLIKHLFELCQHEKVNILKAFENLDFSKCNKVTI